VTQTPFDLVIVGGGIAGMCAALRAPAGARVVVIDKGASGAGSSPLAQGGMAAAVGPEDSPDLHAADTIAAGAGLCDADVVKDVCAEGPAAVDWLLSLGCAFDRDERGALHLAREGGQTVARSVHERDATGATLVRGLRDALSSRDVERVRARADALLCGPDGCTGVMAEGRPFTGRATLVATGGAGGLWGTTTNAPGAAGDGIVLALLAGAQLADLEFMQFHPTALGAGAPGGRRALLTEALRGHGAPLVDEDGERFVDELAPRHVVTKAILERGGAFLDLRGIERLEDLFPTVVASTRAAGIDPARELVPVAPAAHYFIGGIAADAWGRTSIPGLYAAGECASTGMHGANRMAGNSLLETVVVGARAGQRVAAEEARGAGLPTVGAAAPPAGLAAILWSRAGPIRDAAGLDAARAEIAALAAGGHTALASMIVSAAAARLESRGVHIRSDFPDPAEAFAARSFDARPAAMRD